MKEKSHDIDQLRHEVERLSGEIEVLRGVVEEGLKERRTAREQTQKSCVSELSGFRESMPASAAIESGHDEQLATPTDEQQGHSESEDEDQARSGYLSPSPSPSPRPSPGHSFSGYKTVQTDQATIGSPPLKPSTSQPFVSPQEIQRIAEEVSERRSERSNSVIEIHAREA